MLGVKKKLKNFLTQRNLTDMNITSAQKNAENNSENGINADQKDLLIRIAQCADLELKKFTGNLLLQFL